MPTLPALPLPDAPDALIARRPDVGAAEARVAAAGLRVSEARKALLPRFTLTASATGAGVGIEDVTDVDRLVTTVLAGLTLPLFQGGALRAEAAAASADRNAAAAAYVTSALTAWREVEDALSADQSLAVRERELTVAADEAREAQTLAEREYERGVATIFELIDAYTRRIDAERGLISARAARVSNRIAYHVAVAEPAFAPEDTEG
jgi:outer membrane protein TolC